MMDAAWRAKVYKTLEDRDANGLGVSTRFARGVLSWQEKQEKQIEELTAQLAQRDAEIEKLRSADLLDSIARGLRAIANEIDGRGE